MFTTKKSKNRLRAKKLVQMIFKSYQNAFITTFIRYAYA